MSTAWILIIVLVVLVLLSGPYTGYHQYGWRPSGVLAAVLVIVLVLVLLGRL